MNDDKLKNTLPLKLAEWACAVDESQLPSDVLKIASHSLLDWYTMVLVGWNEPAVANLRRYLNDEPGAPQATLLGSNSLASLTHAALINGISGHVLDFDDAHLPSRVHPSVPLWPAILALCEHQGLSGKQALAAFVIGVEIQTRLAALMGESHYRLGWHNTATLGSFGATAALGWLRKLTPIQMCHAFGITASQTGGLRSSFGTSCKPLHAGRAAANGLFATGLAKHAFDAQSAVFDVADGFPALYADETFPDAVIQKDGNWDIRQVIFKYHASCYGTQAPVEAALKFNRPDFASVSSVRVGVETQYLSVCNIQTPKTAAQARFSIRHMVALALEGFNTASQHAFSSECLTDPQIAAWRERIAVYGDAAIARANSSIDVEFTDGTQQRVTVDASRPESNLERQQHRLCEKSAALLQDLYIEGGEKILHDRILGIDKAPDLHGWMEDFRVWESQHRLNQHEHTNTGE